MEVPVFVPVRSIANRQLNYTSRVPNVPLSAEPSTSIHAVAYLTMVGRSQMHKALIPPAEKTETPPSIVHCTLCLSLPNSQPCPITPPPQHAWGKPLDAWTSCQNPPGTTVHLCYVFFCWAPFIALSHEDLCFKTSIGFANKTSMPMCLPQNSVRYRPPRSEDLLKQTSHGIDRYVRSTL
jgi:hypothetical protein